MGIYFYLAGAILFLAALAGAGFKGFQLGGDRVRVEWNQANQAAQGQIAADKQAQERKARKSAQIQQAKIATQEIINRQLKNDLSRELAKNPLPAACLISDGLRDVINAALDGKSPAAGVLPSAGKPPSEIGNIIVR